MAYSEKFKTSEQRATDAEIARKRKTVDEKRLIVEHGKVMTAKELEDQKKKGLEEDNWREEK